MDEVTFVPAVPSGTFCRLSEKDPENALRPVCQYDLVNLRKKKIEKDFRVLEISATKKVTGSISSVTQNDLLNSDYGNCTPFCVRDDVR